MNKFDRLYNFMSEFEARILDLETVSRLIRAANETAGKLESADRVMNLLVAADQLLSDQTDQLHDDFQVVWKEFMAVHHNPKTWYAEVEADYSVPIPDVVLKELGWVEGDQLNIEALGDKTIYITKIQSS